MISLRDLFKASGLPGGNGSLRDFLATHHPGVLSLRQAASGRSGGTVERLKVDG